MKEAVKRNVPPPNKPVSAMPPPKPQRPRIVINDTTVEALADVLEGEPRGVLAVRDELAGWLGSMNKYSGANSDRPFYLEAWNGHPYTIDRKKRPEPQVIPRLSVPVMGGVQPDKMASLFMGGDDDGLMSRILLSWPEPVRPQRPTTTYDMSAMGTAFERLRSLPMMMDDTERPDRRVVGLDEDAANAFETWRQEIADECAHAVDLMAGHLGKFPGMCLRLALVLEYLWWSSAPRQAEPTAVTADAILAAAGLLDGYFKQMAERCYGEAMIPEVEKQAAILARHIYKNRLPRLNVREIYREAKLPGLKKPDHVRAAVGVLAEAHWLFDDHHREGDSQGRKREDYLVNPRLWETRDGK